MARDDKLTAPYAPIKNVLDVIHRLRDRGVPNPLTPESIQSVGVPDGNAHRTLFAMRFLGLIDENGGPTETASRMKQASTAEYPVVLGEIVRDAYHNVFELVDPAKDSEIEISDAFRRFDPPGQRFRMVPLFMGLCAEAGIVDSEKAGQVKVARPQRGARKVKPRDRTGNGTTGSGAKAGDEQRHRQPEPTHREPPPAGQLFSVSEDDIGALGEEEFADVWNALGVLARARARSRKEALERQREDEQERARVSQGMWTAFTNPPAPTAETAEEEEAE